jgi:hypothetical protein
VATASAALVAITTMAEASVASVEVTGASAALVAITVVAEASVASVEVTTASAALAAATASAEAASVAAADSAEAAGTGKGLPPRGRRGKVLCEGQRGRPFPDQNFI